MRIATTKPLFAWDCLDDSPTLKTIKQLLEVIPDRLGQEPHLTHLHDIFHAMIRRLGEVVGDQEVRTPVQRPHGSRTSQRATESILGRRRRQRERQPPVLRAFRRGADGACGVATLLAMAPRREGTLGQTKLSPIAEALHGKVTKRPAPRRRRRRASQEKQMRLRFAG